jgi:hypothetical protein
VKKLVCPVANGTAVPEGGSTVSNATVFYLHCVVEHFDTVMITDIWEKLLPDISGSWTKE